MGHFLHQFDLTLFDLSSELPNDDPIHEIPISEHMVKANLMIV